MKTSRRTLLMLGATLLASYPISFSATEASDRAQAMCNQAESMIIESTGLMRDEINAKTFDFVQDLGPYTDPTYTEVADGVSGDASALSKLLSGIADHVRSTGAVLGPLNNVFESCREYGATALIVGVATIDLQFPDDTHAVSRFKYTNLVGKVNGKWVLIHQHRSQLACLPPACQ